MATAYINDKQTHIIVDTAYIEKERIKQVPGSSWNSIEKHWQVPLTWASCMSLRGIFKDKLVLGQDLVNWAKQERAHRVDLAMSMREMHDPQGLDLDIDPRLYPFQKAGVEFLLTAGNSLLGDDMGTGKTAQMLSTLRALGPSALPALVVCPNSVKRSWDREARMWYPDVHPHIISGSAAQRDKLINYAKNDKQALVIVNFEAMRLLSRLAPFGNTKLMRCISCDDKHGDPELTASRCEVHPKIFNTFQFKSVIVDEAHRIKEPKSKQTRATWAMMHSKTVQHRYALTGTPVANHPGDLWSIMHGVCLEEYPTKSKFMDRYAMMTLNSFGGIDISGLNPDTKPEFYAFFDPRYRRMRKVDVLKDLPPKVRIIRNVEMQPKQRKAYTEMEAGALTKLDNGDLVIANGNLAVATRLIQFSSSYAVVEDDEVKLSEPSPKLDVLEEIIEELEGKQIAVAAVSRQLIDLAAARLDKAHISYGKITGHVSQADRQHVLDKFQDGKLQVMLFTIQAGGTGLTMTAADTIVFLQRSWSLIENKQSEDRVHRIGSEHHESVTVIDIVTSNSIEEDQIINLTEKMLILDDITRDGVADFADSLLEK